MVESFYFDKETRSFSTPSSNTSAAIRKSQVLKNIMISVGAGVALQVIPAVIRVLQRRKGAQEKDRLLFQKNSRINNLVDNYKSGVSAKTDPDTIKKYKEEISTLVTETMAYTLHELDGEDKTLFKTTIAPFIAVLGVILIRECVVLTGTSIGADRRDFEIVFSPQNPNPEDVAKDPYRTVLYKHSWPAHDFRVTSRGHDDAKKLINDTINWLSENPKYLSIRV